MTVSTESAITSRDTSEKCMPSCPMEMPSETEMVQNSSGYPPAACTPFFTALASRSSERLQGVISFQLDATPICGLAKSSSPIPTARSIPRAAARSRPSVTSRERGLMSGAPGDCSAMARAYDARRTCPPARQDVTWLRRLGGGLEPGQPLLEVPAHQLVHRHHLAEQVHHHALVLAAHPPRDVRAEARRHDRELDLLGVAHRLHERELDLDAVRRGVGDLHPALTGLAVALPGVVRAHPGGRSGVGAAERRVDVFPG